MTNADEKTSFSAPLVLVSDIHLRAASDSRAKLLEAVIARCHGGQVEYFVLLGDIFDFCFGGSRYFREKFAKIGEALARLAQSGTRVVFVEGNHEFDMASMRWSGVEFVQAFDFELKFKGSKERVRICHGDLLNAPPLYLVFRAVVKSRFFKFIGRCIPGRWIDRFSLKYAEYSRAQDPYRVLPHAQILGAANQWLDAGDAHHGVFGHFHVPYDHKRKSGTGRIMSVDSWDKPSVLLFDGREFFREFLN